MQRVLALVVLSLVANTAPRLDLVRQRRHRRAGSARQLYLAGGIYTARIDQMPGHLFASSFE